MNTNLVSKMRERAGSYTGLGINHEGQPFTGIFGVSVLLNGAGIGLTFRAVGEDGTIFHDEITTIASNLTGEVGLYNLNSNMPGLVYHKLTNQDLSKDGVEVATFSFGQPTDTQMFREEIKIEIHRDGSIGYRYAWGIPGGEFADRSGVLVRPV